MLRPLDLAAGQAVVIASNQRGFWFRARALGAVLEGRSGAPPTMFRRNHARAYRCLNVRRRAIALHRRSVSAHRRLGDDLGHRAVFRAGVCGIVDGFIYAEPLSVTWAATNLAKIAFRRPRPSAYREQVRREAAGGTSTPEERSATHSAMSFFSGHASIVALVSGAALTCTGKSRPSSAPGGFGSGHGAVSPDGRLGAAGRRG